MATRKEYTSWLNELGAPKDDLKSNGGGARPRPCKIRELGAEKRPRGV